MIERFFIHKFICFCESTFIITNVNSINLWKYVDDTSMAKIVHKGQPSGIQVSVKDLVRQAELDKFQLNETKCKELQIPRYVSQGPQFPLKQLLLTTNRLRL